MFFHYLASTTKILLTRLAKKIYNIFVFGFQCKQRIQQIVLNKVNSKLWKLPTECLKKRNVSKYANYLRRHYESSFHTLELFMVTLRNLTQLTSELVYLKPGNIRVLPLVSLKQIWLSLTYRTNSWRRGGGVGGIKTECSPWNSQDL